MGVRRLVPCVDLAGDVVNDTLIRRIATAASLALVAVVITTAGVIAWPAVAPTPAPPAAAPIYAAGSPIDTPAEWHASSEFTLILFAQASCGACQNASPYLRTLFERLEGRADVVMAGPGNFPDYDREYGRALGLADDAIKVLPAGTRLRATPTLVVVNERGEVLGSWEGVGPEAEHPALTAAIDAIVPAR
jgi:hypothetical protein